MEKRMKVLPKGLPDSIITHLYEAAEAYGLEPDEDTIARLGGLLARKAGHIQYSDRRKWNGGCPLLR